MRQFRKDAASKLESIMGGEMRRSDCSVKLGRRWYRFHGVVWWRMGIILRPLLREWRADIGLQLQLGGAKGEKVLASLLELHVVGTKRPLRSFYSEYLEPIIIFPAAHGATIEATSHFKGVVSAAWALILHL